MNRMLKHSSLNSYMNGLVSIFFYFALTSMILIISLGPSMFGSNSTLALLVAKATTAFATPFFPSRVFSIKRTQEVHVIPSIYIR